MEKIKRCLSAFKVHVQKIASHSVHSVKFIVTVYKASKELCVIMYTLIF